MSKIIMGETASIKQADRFLEMGLVMVKRWWGWVFCSVLATVWFGLFIMWSRGFRHEARLLQRFQRRRNIALKSYALMMAIIAFVVVSSASLYNPKADFTLLFVTLILLSLSCLSFLPRRSAQHSIR